MRFYPGMKHWLMFDWTRRRFEIVPMDKDGIGRAMAAIWMQGGECVEYQSDGNDGPVFCLSYCVPVACKLLGLKRTYLTPDGLYGALMRSGKGSLIPRDDLHGDGYV